MKKIRSSVSEATGIPLEVISDIPRLELTGRKALYIENHKGIKSLTDTSITIKTSYGLIYAEGKNIAVKEINKEFIRIYGVFTSFRIERQE